MESSVSLCSSINSSISSVTGAGCTYLIDNVSNISVLKLDGLCEIISITLNILLPNDYMIICFRIFGPLCIYSRRFSQNLIEIELTACAVCIFIPSVKCVCIVGRIRWLSRFFTLKKLRRCIARTLSIFFKNQPESCWSFNTQNNIRGSSDGRFVINSITIFYYITFTILYGS